MLPTLAEVLALPPVRRGRPKVRAGRQLLERPVRWVHVAEVSDIAHLLEGGELILTTGIALPSSARGLRRYVAELSEVGAAALVVELVRRYPSGLPDELVDAAEQAQLPVVELRRETPFVAVTQAVHALILDARMQELLAADDAHRAFTELTMAGAGAQDVVDLVASLSGCGVVYEGVDHRVLAGSGVDVARWDEHAAALPDAWLAVEVGPASGGEWGRLVLVADHPPGARERTLLERGATALMIDRLTARDLEGLEQQTHRTVLTALAFGDPVPPETAARSRALGVPLERRHLTGVVVRAAADTGDAALLRELASQAGSTLAGLGVPALIGPIDDQRVAVLLSQERAGAADRVLGRLSERLHAVREHGHRAAVVVGAGSTVTGPAHAQATLREAIQVADTARLLAPRRAYFRPPDLQLRGLVHALHDEPALREYVDRELGAVLAHDSGHGGGLYDFLAAYCRHGGNKTAAAAELFISRAALYDRIAKVEKLLDTDLGDAEVVLSLHFAVLAREVLLRPGLAVSAR